MLKERFININSDQLFIKNPNSVDMLNNYESSFSITDNKLKMSMHHSHGLTLAYAKIENIAKISDGYVTLLDSEVLSKTEKLLVPKQKTVIFEEFPVNNFEEGETLIIIVKIYGENTGEIVALSIKSKVNNGNEEFELESLHFFDSKKSINFSK